MTDRWKKIAIDLVSDHNWDRIESHVAAARRAMIAEGMTDPWPDRPLIPHERSDIYRIRRMKAALEWYAAAGENQMCVDGGEIARRALFD